MVTPSSDDNCKTVFSEGKIVNLQGAHGPTQVAMVLGKADLPEGISC